MEGIIFAVIGEFEEKLTAWLSSCSACKCAGAGEIETDSSGTSLEPKQAQRTVCMQCVDRYDSGEVQGDYCIEKLFLICDGVRTSLRSHGFTVEDGL